MGYTSLVAWLDRLDRATHHWSIKAPYLAVRWYLIALGAFILIRLVLDRINVWPLY